MNSTSNGFYINAKSRMKSARGAARYIGRYLARPAIAEYKIHSYDGENVTFWYKSHETNERVKEIVMAQVFIGRLLMHIQPKYFKIVRSYGVYAGSVSVKVQKCFDLLQYIKSVGMKKKYLILLLLNVIHLINLTKRVAVLLFYV